MTPFKRTNMNLPAYKKETPLFYLLTLAIYNSDFRPTTL